MDTTLDSTFSSSSSPPHYHPIHLQQQPRTAAAADVISSVSAFARAAKRPSPDDATRLGFAVEMFASMCRHFSDSLGADAEAYLSVFHSIAEPGISLRDYMERLDRHTKCGEEAVLIGIIIAARYCVAVKILPSRLSMHRLLLVSTRIASKAHHDVFRSNRAFAKYGGMTLLEMNELEALALVKLNYGVLVHGPELKQLRDTLEQISANNTLSGRAANVRALIRVLHPQWAAPLSPPSSSLLAASTGSVRLPFVETASTSFIALASSGTLASTTSSSLTSADRRSSTVVSGTGPSAIRAIHNWRTSLLDVASITSPCSATEDLSLSSMIGEAPRDVVGPAVAGCIKTSATTLLLDRNPPMPPVRLIGSSETM